VLFEQIDPPDVAAQCVERAMAEARLDHLEALIQELHERFARRLPDVPLHQRGFGVMEEMPEPQKQRTGRQEMALRLRDEGPAAAADYAVRFERYANECLVWNGYAPGFVFSPIPLPAVS
jgi:hypothetical protein